MTIYNSVYRISIFFFLALQLSIEVYGIICYISNETLATKAVDCHNLGIQREELYCRNITSPDGTIHRNCVAMSWYDSTWEELGCHTSKVGFIRCTCGEDLCNAPSILNSVGENLLPSCTWIYFSLLTIVIK